MFSFIEPLEARLAPASLVSVSFDRATGVLGISSTDHLAHEVTITATGSKSFRIEGIDTDIHSPGQHALEFTGKIIQLTYTGGDAEDSLRLTGMKLAALTFTGGAGDDALVTTDLTVSGPVQIDLGAADSPGGMNNGVSMTGSSLYIGGDLTITYGDGGVVVVDALRTTIKGGIALTGGAAGKQFRLGGGVTTVGAGLSFPGEGERVGADLLVIDSGTSLMIGKNSNGVALSTSSGINPMEIVLSGHGPLTLNGIMDIMEGADGPVALNMTADRVKITGSAWLSRVAMAEADCRSLAIGGDLFLEYPDAGGVVRFRADTLSITGDVTAFGKSNADLLELTGPSVKLNGKAEIKMDAGENSVQVSGDHLRLGEFTTIGGPNADHFAFRAITLVATGELKLEGGDGADILEIAATTGTYLKGARISGGSGDNTANFRHSKVTAKGDLTFSLDGGANTFDFTNTVARIDGNLSVYGGSGNDDVHFKASALSVSDDLTFSLSDGINQIELDVMTATVGRGFDVLGGAGDDVFTLSADKMTVGGFTTLWLKDGDNFAKLQGRQLTFKKTIFAEGGNGRDHFIFTGGALSASRSLFIDLRSGENILSLTSNQVTLGFMLGYDGGGDRDQFLIKTNQLKVANLVLIDTKGGNDDVRLESSSFALQSHLTVGVGYGGGTTTIRGQGTIAGDLLLIGHRSYTSTVQIGDDSGLPGLLRIGGAFSISLPGGSPTGPTNYVRVANLKVSKEISILTGDAPCEVHLHRLDAGSTLKLYGGNGNDVIHFEDQDVYGSSRVAKNFAVLFGAGDDQLHIGASTAAGSDDFVRFFGAISVDGGTGTNTRNLFESGAVNFLGSKATLSVTGF